MIEIYKDIQGYEGLYQVSNLGNVKSLGNGGSNVSKERVLKSGKTKKGYLTVALCKQARQRTYQVHRLVALHFIPNPNNYEQVNHKDEDKTNNSVINLEWCTAKQNANYGTRNEKLSKQVMCIETGVIYQSLKEASKQIGVSFSSLSMACNGKNNTCGGFHWKYVS